MKVLFSFYRFYANSYVPNATYLFIPVSSLCFLSIFIVIPVVVLFSKALGCPRARRLPAPVPRTPGRPAA
jgi:hypothetical protein